MVFTDAVKEYFLLISSNIRKAMADAQSLVPFGYDNEGFFQAYEALSQLWTTSTSLNSVTINEKLAKSTVNKWEENFILYGAAGLLPQLQFMDVDPALERLVVLIKSTRPHESASLALRLADALKIPGASLDLIRQIQRCHGFGQNMNEKDREYFQGLQHILLSVELHQKKQTKKQSVFHDKNDKKNSFLNFKKDHLQHRVELFKELSAIKKSGQTRAILKKYGITPTRFYILKDRYMLYGIWGLCNLVQTTKLGEAISPDLELQIIEERLMNPKLSPPKMIDKLELKCSASNVKKIYSKWGLNKFKTSIPIRGVVSEPIEDLKINKKSPLRLSAKTQFPELIGENNLKVRSDFNKLLESLGRREICISNPGALIIAPFLNQLGIVEALQTYGPSTRWSGYITNYIIVNVLRIISGFPTINDFTMNSDRSVAIGSGLTMNPQKTRFYEFFDELRFHHLKDLRNDVACRARELGIIEGVEIAIDYHCDPSDSRYPRDKMLSKSPDKAGDLVYAHRPQILWDSCSNSIINIAYCPGKSRAPTALYKFCEENLFSVIDKSVIKEIYADSEYTGEKQLVYLIDRTDKNVTMCLKQNPKIKKWREEAIKLGKWENYGDTYKIISKDFILAESGKSFRFIVKKHNETGSIRCFGSTHIDYTPIKILELYHLRWPIETGIKDLIENYFLNNPPGTSAEKIEMHYYCIMIARLTVDYFLSLFQEKTWQQSDDWDCVLSTIRSSIFANQSCTLGLDESGDLLLTYLDGDNSGIKKRLGTFLKSRTEAGLNTVPWWGNRGIQIRSVNQYENRKN